MLCVAAVLDGIGYVLLLLSFFGVDDYGILDIIGLVIFGGWLLMRTGSTQMLEQAKEKTKETAQQLGEKSAKKGGGAVENVAKKAGKRLGLSFLVELVPILGSLWPSWIILVYRELK